MTLVVMAFALAGCEEVPVPQPSPVTPAVQTAPVTPGPETVASAAVRAYYGQVQASLLSQGLLRTDMGGADTPFTDRNLTDNFLKIALYEEYAHGQVSTVRGVNPIRLLRWSQPVRMALIFGASVPKDKRATDTLRVASFLARLSRVTGHQIALNDTNPNFWLHIASIDERAALGPALASELSELTPGQIASVTAMDRDTYCQVLTQSNPHTSTYVAAVAVIPSEQPDLLRLSCIHEELAQALGLPNDSNAVRPSIFNDDEEFALLTRQDELMLRILYNPALHPGMSEAEARPIVQTLASRLMGGES
ncbi:MAG: DUF2927 domain-containing protein [Paracoccaceae bacterium]